MSLLLAFLLLGTNAAAPAAPDSACEHAAYLFFNRNQNPAWLDSAVAILGQARSRSPGDERCLYLWARVQLQLGEQAVGKAEKLGYYTRARAIADTLRRLNDLNPDGHMWWATAQGRIGQLAGMVRAAGMVRSIKREYLRTVELDSGYALAWYALGRLYRELPGIVGGSRSKAEGYLKRGIEADPHSTVIRLELARLWLERGRRDEARIELERVLAEERPTNPAEYVLSDRPAAEVLLRDLPPGQP